MGPESVQAEPVQAVDVIRAKREGKQLSPAQIDWVIAGYSRGVVAEEQMSALAMAILLNGMTGAETARWTAAMLASGQVLRHDAVERPTVDKHSTGGVGDKVTLVLAPVIAACGAAMPHLAGRGLGYTGGTLDKLEAIKHWRAELTAVQLQAQLREVGAVIAAAGADLAPADRKLYALRDVTGTVESIPLIAASIMSKKLAAGAQALVFDVKVGSGALLPELAQARELAELLVELGSGAGVRTRAVLTAMDVPLGRSAGNALEVAEALEVLTGGGPADVVALTVRLAEEMLDLAQVSGPDPAQVLRDGRAMDCWRQLIQAQGGDPAAPLPKAAHQHEVTAERAGVLTGLDAYGIGVAAWRLGAGRARKEDPIDPAAGVQWHVAPGDEVVRGQRLLTLHTNTPAAIPVALQALAEQHAIGISAPQQASASSPRFPLIIEEIG